MRSFTRMVRRQGTPFSIFLAALAVSGCATKEARYTAGEDAYGSLVSAREYGYVRPAGEAARGTRPGRSPQGSGADLWTRVRADMKLNLHANGRIDEKVSAFRRDPQFLSKLSDPWKQPVSTANRARPRPKAEASNSRSPAPHNTSPSKNKAHSERFAFSRN